MKIRTIIFTTLSVFTFLISASMTFSQAEEINLHVSRDFGYGGLNGDIQGVFSMKVTGPADLIKVVFYIDNSIIGEVNKAPFNLQFNTDNYPIGQHKLYAIGFSSAGKQYRSNEISSNFVTASEGTNAALQIVIPILAIVFGAILLSLLIPLVSGRGKVTELPLGVERKYGLSGGICPKCHRPFALPVFSLNLGLSKLARCPYCGKWNAVRIETMSKLRAAEQAELEWGKGEVKEETEEEKLAKELDDSKFQRS